MTTPGTIRLRASRAKLARLGVVAAAFTAIGIAMIVAGDRRGWVTASFFGLCVVVFGLQLIAPAELLLTEQGMQTTTLYRRSPLFDWRYCSNFHVWAAWPRRMVVFDYAGPEIAKRPRRASASRSLSGANSGLPDTYGMKPDDLCRMLTDYQQAALAARPTDHRPAERL